MTVMPMFPLSNVLMPAMPLSLRIFEERYLKLTGDLILQENPEFGVVLIERGPEVGGGEKRAAVPCQLQLIFTTMSWRVFAQWAMRPAARSRC